MKKNSLFIAFTAMALSVSAQTTIPNGDFENWGGNASPGIPEEPTGWYSNKSGSSTAQLGPHTAFQETSNPHSGTSSLRVETISYLYIAKVNGSLTTGVINAPDTDKSRGYVGTKNYTTATDVRRTPFVGRPDSLVGWYKYTSGGTSNGIAEKGKIVAVLHTGHYNDPEVPVAANASVYSDLSANRVGKALFNTPTTNVTAWTRFSVPFDYASGATPEYIMISITSSDNQTTNVVGSKLWLDDLEVIYNPSTPTACDEPTNLTVVNNNTSIDFSWTAPTVAPAQGYAYAVLPFGATPGPTDFVQSASTSVTGITATTGASSSAMVDGNQYVIHLISVCDIATADVSSEVSASIIFGTATCDAPSNLLITQQATTIDLSWTAAATVPAEGYGYGILSADSSQSTIPMLSTTDTFKNGITGTTAQFSELFEAGKTYNVYVTSLCGPSSTDPSITLTSSTLIQSFVFNGGVGVNETAFNQFQVYAFNKQLYVDLSDVSENNAFVAILDLTGKEVLKVKLNGNEKNTIAIPSTIQTGTYFYQISGSSIQKTGKIAL